MKRLFLAPVAALVIGLMPHTASARTNLFFGLNFGGPFSSIGIGVNNFYRHGHSYFAPSFGFSYAAAPAYYYAPAPYYSAPAYAYAAPAPACAAPAAVYVAPPAPVYVAPAYPSTYFYFNYGYGGGWHGGGRYYYGHR